MEPRKVWRARIGWLLLVVGFVAVARYEPELVHSWFGEAILTVLFVWGLIGFRSVPLRWERWRQVSTRSWVLLGLALAVTAMLNWYPPAQNFPAEHPSLTAFTLLMLYWAFTLYAYLKNPARFALSRRIGTVTLSFFMATAATYPLLPVGYYRVAIWGFNLAILGMVVGRIVRWRERRKDNQSP